MPLHVTLPSNGIDFPNNTTSTYTVKLNHPLLLEGGEWEIGLADIHYPSSWTNVDEGKLIFRDESNAAQTYELRSGSYASCEEVVSEIKRCLMVAKQEESMLVYHDKVRNKTYVNVKRSRTAVEFSEDICQILGLKIGHYYAKGKHEGEYTPDIRRGMSALYVYVSVAEPRPVGDTMSPLLRVIPIDSVRSDTSNYMEFKNIQFVPVSNTNTDLIEVLIRNDTGATIPFTSGKVVLTVVFRPSKNRPQTRW